jgi:hypothetical protein
MLDLVTVKGCVSAELGGWRVGHWTRGLKHGYTLNFLGKAAKISPQLLPFGWYHKFFPQLAMNLGELLEGRIEGYFHSDTDA